MNDLYNIKAFLIQTKTRTTLDHEISSKRPISFDFFAYPTNYNKCWMSFASNNSSSTRKIQTNFGISLLYGNKYRIKAKLADFRSPKVSISSVLPLPGNPRCFVKFSPRTEEQDNVFALIGFTDEIDKFKITSALLIQNKYHILSKIGFQPWKGLFLNSFVNYDISNRRIVDYAGMIGYEYRNWEFFLRQTYQDSHYNSNLESTSIALGCCYKYDSRLTLAMWLRSQQASKDVKSVKEKVVFGGRYQIDDKSYLKVKANDNLGYSMLYKLLCNDKFTLAARFTNSFKKSIPWSDAVGLRIRYHLH